MWHIQREEFKRLKSGSSALNILYQEGCTYVMESQQLEKELAEDKTAALEQQISTSLYEDMVKMAYKDPDRIASIRQIVEKADESVIPDHFVEMYSTFENVLKRIKRL